MPVVVSGGSWRARDVAALAWGCTCCVQPFASGPARHTDSLRNADVVDQRRETRAISLDRHIVSPVGGRCRSRGGLRARLGGCAGCALMDRLVHVDHVAGWTSEPQRRRPGWDVPCDGPAAHDVSPFRDCELPVRRVSWLLSSMTASRRRTSAEMIRSARSKTILTVRRPGGVRAGCKPRSSRPSTRTVRGRHG